MHLVTFRPRSKGQWHVMWLKSDRLGILGCTWTGGVFNFREKPHANGDSLLAFGDRNVLSLFRKGRKLS